MTRRFESFADRLPEAACLEMVQRLRHAGAACPACARAASFSARPKHRAYSCDACGFKVYPCQATPFARPQPPLQHWFYAIHLRATGLAADAKALRGALGLSTRAAARLSEAVAALERAGPCGTPAVDWFERVHTHVADQLAAAPPASPSRASGRGPARYGLLLGAGFGAACLAFVLLVASLLVPPEAEEDAELAQATAVLSLASDEPVVLVSQDVAQQLYEVTDLDAAGGASLVPVIRLLPAGQELRRIPVGEARPLGQPSVKLASSVGASILGGDLSDVKRKALARPELAAYGSLAAALEPGTARDPNEVLTFGPMRIRRHLVEKIVRAARVTQMDPVLLMAIADKESSFATEVQAQTSSATGLFQFIERTWLGVVRDFGAQYGLEREAALVAQAGEGSLRDGAVRLRILALRQDAYLSAVLAAEMLKRDSERIGRRIGRALTGGEVYLVHFLGPDGTERLIERARVAPDAAAASLLPRPAEANRPIFYAADAGGTIRSLSVSALREKFEGMIGLRLNRYRGVHAVASDPQPVVLQVRSSR